MAALICSWFKAPRDLTGEEANRMGFPRSNGRNGPSGPSVLARGLCFQQALSQLPHTCLRPLLSFTHNFRLSHRHRTLHSIIPFIQLQCSQDNMSPTPFLQILPLPPRTLEFCCSLTSRLRPDWHMKVPNYETSSLRITHPPTGSLFQEHIHGDTGFPWSTVGLLVVQAK